MGNFFKYFQFNHVIPLFLVCLDIL
jgi:hypothetical protein